MRRHDTVDTFRTRLTEVIERSGMSRSEFARRIGADRSTLSQLLAPEGTRLPRAETIAAIAGVAQVSVDWLLGLSAEGQMGTDVLNEAVAIEPLQSAARLWTARVWTSSLHEGVSTRGRAMHADEDVQLHEAVFQDGLRVLLERVAVAP